MPQLETALSFGDEAAGKIVLRGHDLATLASDRSYEDVVAILWDGVVPGEVTQAALGGARVASYARLAPFEAVLQGRPVAEAMRVLVASFDAADGPLAAVTTVGLAATLAMCSAQGRAWAAPDATRGHAADLLAIASGCAPDPAKVRALERYMILMIDHGISASTYAARIAASTGAALGPVMLAALSVLEGPRHGGAPGMVLDQLDLIAGPADVPRAVAAIRAAGKRVMGFGSRAYKGEDLRASLMKREWLAIGGDHGNRAQALEIEQALVAELARINPARGLKANVEYYAALLVEATGVPRAGLTPMFAAARVAGWVAHAHEQRAEGSMIRPPSRYTGIPLA